MSDHFPQRTGKVLLVDSRLGAHLPPVCCTRCGGRSELRVNSLTGDFEHRDERSCKERQDLLACSLLPRLDHLRVVGGPEGEESEEHG